MFGFGNYKARAAALLEKESFGYLIDRLPEYISYRDFNDIVAILEDKELVGKWSDRRYDVLKRFLENL